MKEKVEKIRQILKDDEAAIIISDANRFYLTGFHSSAGLILITKRCAVFFIDFRYYEKAKKTVCNFEVVLQTDLINQLKTYITTEKITSAFVEAERITLDKYGYYSEKLSINIYKENTLDKLIENMRAVKSEDELRNIKIAQEYTDNTFSYILNRIEPGRTEREIMLDMEFYMRRLGSEGIAFDFIVVSGKNSSLPHGVPTDKAIEKGDFITMDFGAVYNGYRSDMTRTVAVGEVSDTQRKVYNTVLEAQLAAIDSIKPGKICKDIDKVARDIIYNAGYEGKFGHSLGHSVGVEIHEYPAFSLSCGEIIKPDMVITVEPGIYIENTFGVRIEDMIVVTNSGCLDLTKSTKELLII